MQFWNRSMTSSRLRRLGCAALGASEAARERRRTEAAAGHGARAGALLLVVVGAERERGRRRLQQPRTGRHRTGGRRSRRRLGGGSGGVLGWRHLGLGVWKAAGERGSDLGNFARVSASCGMCWAFGSPRG